MNTKIKLGLGVVVVALLVGGVYMSDNGGFKGALVPLSSKVSPAPAPAPIPVLSLAYIKTAPTVALPNPGTNSMTINLVVGQGQRPLAAGETLTIMDGSTQVASSDRVRVNASNGQLALIQLPTGFGTTYAATMNFDQHKRYDVTLTGVNGALIVTRSMMPLNVTYSVDTSGANFVLINGAVGPRRQLLNGETLMFMKGVNTIASSDPAVARTRGAGSINFWAPSSQYILSTTIPSGMRYDSYLLNENAADGRPTWSSTVVLPAASAPEPVRAN